MSRATLRDNSSAVSLFPFLAVLLCTMGALLLMLVVVTRVSRLQSARKAEADKQNIAATTRRESAHDANRRLVQVNGYVDQLNDVARKAEQKLREDQLRLQHIEDHMRRLHNQMDSLRMAAAELDALEDDHFDDRMQAEREVARLHQLIAENRRQIQQLVDEQQGNSRSYSIVPYKGANGTSRRPIYVECRRDAVILQPEGIRLQPDDFQQPLGAGNALASALRAAREHLIRRNPATGQSADTEPYPLILVRPEGIGAYYRVRAAIESWDSDFGYELVDGEWELEFPAADPELARVEYQAVEQARARKRLLAAAAPRAYGGYAAGSGGGGSDTFEIHPAGNGGNGDGEFGPTGPLLGSDDIGDDGFGGAHRTGKETPANSESGGATAAAAGSGTGGLALADPRGGGALVPGGTGLDGSEHGGPTELSGSLAAEVGMNDGTGTAPPSASGPAGAGAAGESLDSPGALTERRTGSSSNDRATSTGASSGAAQGMSGGGSGSNPSSGASGAPSRSAASMGSAASAPAEGGAASVSVHMNPNRQTFAEAVGDWASKDASPTDVPIRRAVQVVVRSDRISILPDMSQSSGSGTSLAGGTEIPLKGPTNRALDDFLSGLKEHMRQWGMAGSGLYWRPVLKLNVAPDGQERADDLVRLLENSGIEVRNSAPAHQAETIDGKTTR